MQEGGSSCFTFWVNQVNDRAETLISSIVLELSQDVADLPDLDEENAQESLSQKVKAIIHELENIPHQPSVEPSEHEAELSFQLSTEVNHKLGDIEQEGGLSAPDSSPSQGVALPLGGSIENQGKPFEKPSDQSNVDLRGLPTHEMELRKTRMERQMEDFNTNRNGVRHLSAKPGKNGKLDEVVDRIQKKSGLKASIKGEDSSDFNMEPRSEPGQSTYGAVGSKTVFIHIWCADMGKDFRITSKAKKRMTKVMEAVAQRLGKTVTSLKFLAEKEKGMMAKLLNDPKEAIEESGWIRLHGEEEVGTFAGATVVVKKN